ncbi:hypothetical protein [Mesotoga sp. UBA5557]
MLADWSNGVLIIEISNPKNPILIGHIMNTEYSDDRSIEGSKT